MTAPAVATFSVTATGSAILLYQWSKNGTAIAGATSPSYTTPPTAAADDGAIFTVSVTNSAGRVTSDPATLTVNAAPSIIAQPQHAMVTAPATATFEVTAAGTAPLHYQWSKNGAAIAGATSASYTTPSTTTDSNGSSFTVAVSNDFGSVVSAQAILTVNPAPISTPTPSGPVLIGADPRNQSVVAPASATFTATAIGSAPIAYQWRLNGTAISGATSATYTTPPTTLADNGSVFTVTVTNGVNGFTSAPATLTVTTAPAAPVIVAPPQDITVGGTARFYVIATGTEPLGYQWSRNGTAIPGATDASYTTPPATAADNNAQFAVTVTNLLGSVTSDAATLAFDSQASGLGGFQPLTTLPTIYPGNPVDLIGVRYRFLVVTNDDVPEKFITGHSALYTPGQPINSTYDIESSVHSAGLTFANGGCTTWPPLGTTVPGKASLRNSTGDHPYQSGQQPAPGSAINTGDAAGWPVQTYLIDNIAKDYQSESIGQIDLKGLETRVTIERADTLTDVSGFAHCGLTMLGGTYRMWTVTTEVAGQSAVVNQVVVPDADGQYLLPVQVSQLLSQHLALSGTFTVQYWDFAFKRESVPAWAPVTAFTTMYPYNGNGQDFGVHVVSVNGQDRVEFSNVAGLSYLPGNLPFSIAPP